MHSEIVKVTNTFTQNRTFVRPEIKAMKISYYEEVALLIIHHNLS